MTTDRKFFNAAGDLTAELLARLKRDDPQAAGAVAAALSRGGFLCLSVAFGAAGVIDTRLQLVGPAGERATVYELDDAGVVLQ